MEGWTALGAAARDLVLGETCAGCQAPTGGGPVCSGCWAGLAADPRRVRPLDPPLDFPPTFAARDYEGVVRRLLVVHKEQGRLSLARPLGVLLQAAVVAGRAGRRGPEVLVPVPSRRSVTRRRGHDPVTRMARVAAPALGTSVSVRPVLGHRRRVIDQSGLDLEQRRANLGGALAVIASPAQLGGHDVVLVDDICSSGSTLAAASRALRSVGVPAERIRAAVVATPVLRRAWPAATSRGHPLLPGRPPRD